MTDVSNENQDVLAWDEPADNGGAAITGYKVERREIGQVAYETAVDKGATETSHSYSKTSWSVGYEYRVRAVNSEGVSSATIAPVISVAGRPSSLGALTAAAATDRVAIALSWTPPTSTGGKPVTQYVVNWREDAAGDWNPPRGPDGTKTVTSGTAVTLTAADGLAPGTTYNFRYRADNADRVSFFNVGDGSVEATTANIVADPPAAPVLTATAHPTLDQWANLSWTVPDDGGSAITGYRWEARQVGASTWALSGGTSTPTGTTAVVGGLSVSGASEFRVRAMNAAGNGPWSAIRTVAAPPGAPSGLAAASVRGERITIEWTAPSNDGGKPVTQYTYQWGPDDGGATWPNERTTTSTSASLAPLAPGTAYQYRVKARNADRSGDFTAHGTATTLATPASVTGVSATGGPGSVTVTWTAVAGADGYVVVWWKTGESRDPGDRRELDGSTTRTVIDGLQGETEYGVSVTATNSAGNSPVTAASTARATTGPTDVIVSATDPSPLTEDSLDGAKVTVEFLGRPNRVWHHVGAGHFTASGVPGVSVSGVSLLSDRKARLTLAYDDTDFDDDRTLRIDIDGEAFDRYGTRIGAATGVRAVVEPPPARVKNVRATAGTERVRVTWDAVASSNDNPDVNVYRVQWKGPDGGWWRERRVRGSRTSYTIGAAPGTEYTVRVIATKRKAPDGPPSAEARATTPAFGYGVKGTAPAPLTGVNLDGATVTVALQGAEWNLGLPRHRFRLSGLETGVWVERVERISDAEARVVLGHRGPAIAEDGELTITIDADTYTYSRNGDLTVTVPVKAPGQAGGLHVAEVTDTTVTVAWDRFEGGNRLVYEVRWRESASTGRWRGRRTTGTWHQIRDLAPGTDYTVQVRYWDRGGAGFGRWSSAAMTTTVGGTALNQVAGVTIAADDPVPVAEGGTAGYTVVLDGRPSGDVTIAVTSDNADVTAQPASLTFTADDWHTPRTVTVRAAQDGDAADDSATLGHAVSGAQGYAGIAVASVAVAVTDDDGAGVTVSETDLSLEEGGSATYTVVLDTPPAGDVVIHPVAHGAGLTVQPASLTFTPENWQTPQTVTVSAAHDDDAEDGQGFVTHATLVAPGSAYESVIVPSVTVTVADDDAVGQPAEEQAPWTLTIVRGGQPFETVPETGADAEYPSTFLRLERGSSTAPLPAWLPVTVGGTAANPEDYEFNHGNVFAGLSRQSADVMDGARKITVKADALDEGAETITFSVTIEGETLTATLTITDDEAVGQPAEEQPPWTLELVRNGQPFETVAETGADAEYPSAFLRLVRGSSTAPLPAWLPVTVGGTAANPADYEFNQGNVFAGLSRQSADVMDGARKITVKGDGVAEGAETITFSVTIEGQTLTATLTIADAEEQPPWTLELVRNDRPFTTVAEMDADAEYPSTFLRLKRGTSTAPLPAWLPVTVGGTAANPEDYEFNHGNVFAGLSRQSADVMDGARKITVKADALDEGAETIDFSVTIEGQTLTATLTIAEPRLAVADASVEEAAGAALAFRVTLEPPMGGPVTVDWATADGSAVAGADYTAGSGTLTFAAGETEKIIEVAVLDDDHDEGSETMTLRLSNPSSGVALGDAEATGTIGNTDLMPQAWLARFGRTVADQVIDAVTARFEAAQQPGSRMRIGGHALGGKVSTEAWEACAAWRAAFGDRDRHGLGALADGNRAGLGSGTGGLDDRCRTGVREMTPQQLLAGSSFALTGGSAETGFGTVWGSGAVTRFDGREGGLTLDGEVASATLGADYVRGRATVGLALAHSAGDGSYSGAGSGKIESTLTGLYPYGRYEVSKRLSLWGIAGYGAGTLTLKPEDGARAETDIDMAMAAAGVRAVAVEAPDEGGLELAVKSDALVLRISSDAARDDDGGRLAAADADVTRLRLGLEGTWRGIETEGGGTLTPTLEVGLRHDGGDAETGFGLEAGAGLAWSDPASGIAAEIRASGLLAHEDGGFRERGVSGSFAWDPAPGSDRGPSLSLTQTLGGSASYSADSLFANGAPAGLAANDTGFDARRFEAKFGYGFGAFGDRFTLTPELGFGLSNDSRDYGLGWRLNPSAGGGSSFELRLDATRREAVNDNGAELEHTVGLRLNARW